MTVHFGEPDRATVWVKQAGGPHPEIECSFSPEPQGWEFVSGRWADIHLDVDGDRWSSLLLIGAEPAGEYEVTCLTSGTSAPPLSIGESSRFQSGNERTWLTVGAILTVQVTIATVVLLLLITAIRHLRQRAHLQRQAAGE